MNGCIKQSDNQHRKSDLSRYPPRNTLYKILFGNLPPEPPSHRPALPRNGASSECLVAYDYRTLIVEYNSGPVHHFPSHNLDEKQALTERRSSCWVRS